MENQNMNLQSPSGYAMPFELTESEPLEIIKGYGGNEKEFNHGIDFKVRPRTWAEIPRNRNCFGNFQ